jgi:hopanoid biosynthesis associated RND transporter like protein HpnN
LARFGINQPVAVLAIAVGLAVVSAVYTRAALEFHTGQDDLISAGNRDSRNYLRYQKEFPDLDGLIVVVRAEPDAGRAELFTDALANRLEHDSVNVKSVLHRVDPDLFEGRALLYLSPNELHELSDRLRDHRELLVRYAAEPSLANFFKLINEESSHALASKLVSGLLDDNEAPAPSTESIDVSFLNSVLSGMLDAGGGRFDSPWDRLTRGGGQSGVLRDGYLASDNGKYLLLYVAPAAGAAHGPDPIDVIQGYVVQVRNLFPDIDAGMTGGPALAHAEASSTAHDIALGSVLAIVSNALLIIIPFGGLIKPAFAIIALLIGVAWSFGFTTLAVGHLNLLSAVFTSVLAGIGINFPIHLMARYEEARRRGASAAAALELSVVNTGTGVVASALIMALAFFAPMLTDFKGIAELGLVSGAGLFFCLLSALTVFPALLILQDRNHPGSVRLVRKSVLVGLLQRMFKSPSAIVVVTTGITLGGLFLASRVHFDQNLLKLQAESTEAVKFEERLLKDSGRSSWFAVAMASTREAAEKKASAFRKLDQVADAETISSYIPDEQAQKREMLAQLMPLVTDAKPGTSPQRSDSGELARELKELQFKMKGAARSAPSASINEAARLLELAAGRVRADSHAFDSYGRRMADDFAQKLKMFKRNLTPGEMTEANLPKLMRSRFIGASGVYLIQVYPRGDIWRDAPLRRFVKAVRKVDSDVTGPPIQTFSIATVMRSGYQRAALLALLAVFIFVFADFRNLRDTLLAMVPLIFGSVWLLEAMGLLGWEFNLANLFAVPIIIGMGVDNGVNMVYRWREERDKSGLILTKAVGKSVTICSLTTIAGFAALIPAQHRGISSLGWVLSVGVTLILIATLIVVPALFKMVAAYGGGRPREIKEVPRLRVAGARQKLVCLILAIAAVLASGRAIAQPTPTPASNMLSHSGDRVLAANFVKEAEEMIERAGQHEPLDTTEVHAAIQKLKDAVDLDPKSDAAYIDLGFAYALLKEPNVAIDMYVKATQLNPSGANFKELAGIYLRTGDAAQALMAANAGLTRDPKNAGLYNARGMALHDLMRFAEAKKDFLHATELDPKLEAAKANLEALGEKGKTGRSTVTKPAIATDPAPSQETAPAD